MRRRHQRSCGCNCHFDQHQKSCNQCGCNSYVQDCVIQTDRDLTIVPDRAGTRCPVRITVDVTAAGVTITPPADPVDGDNIIIIASGGDVIFNGDIA